MRAKKKGRKSQALILEFAVAVLALSIAIGAYYEYRPTADKRLNMLDLNNEAKLISDSLMSAGYPAGWTPDSVSRIGLTDGESKLNMTKVKFLGNMSYDNTRFLFGTGFDYLVFFEKRNGSAIPISGLNKTEIGKEGHTRTSVPADATIAALVRTERLVIHEGDIVRMVLYLWSEK